MIVEGLGGINNIADVNNCFSRLRIDVKDPEKVNVDTLKKYPSSGVITKKNNVQIIVGVGVQDVREEFDEYIGNIDLDEPAPI